ncbi:MAG: oligosaccharide flippase family protein [Gammaproteobacteria bacterium]|nr:oligosaccharide flippase family protein [Gammaproteobacteria bacterium]MCF6337244.1 oligosaccharide flippase family protein [Gammaproteobacteria bacterium]
MKKGALRKISLGTVATGLVGQTVTIVSGIMVARALGVEGRGYLALFVIFPLVISYLGTLGIPNSVIYYTASGSVSSDTIKRIFLRLFPLQAVALLLLHVAALGVYLEGKPLDVRMAGYVTLLVVPFILAQQYGMALMQGAGKFVLFNILRLIVPVTYTVAVLVIFITELANLKIILAMWVLANILSGCVAFYMAIGRVENVCHKNAERVSLKQMVNFGIKGLFGSVTPLESFRLDHVLAGFLMSPAMLGLYVVGQAFSNLPQFIARSAGMVVYPAVAGRSGEIGKKKLVWRFFWLVTFFNVVITTLLIAALPYLLPFLFGDDFGDAILLGQVLLVGAVFAASRRIFVEGLRGVGVPHVSTMAEVSMYPWLAIGIPLLVLWYENLGLAIGVVIAYLISLIVALMLGMRELKNG